MTNELRTGRLWGALVIMLAASASGQELVKSGDFNSGTAGWQNQMAAMAGVQSEWQRTGGRGDTGCIHIKGESTDRPTCWIWRHALATAPAGKALRISGWVKGKRVEELAAICVQGWDAKKMRIVDFATTQTTSPLAGDFDWTRIETHFTPSSETREVHILIFITGAGEAWFDDISAVPMEMAEASAASGQPSPGLFEARGAYKLTASGRVAQPTILIPLPISYREQVPLTYTLFTKPADKLARARVYRDQPTNCVADVVLKTLEAGDVLELQWASIVLCGPRSFDDVPKQAALPEQWPKNARPWLRSTRCVQADDERITTVAHEIRGDDADVLEIIDATLARTRKIYADQKGRCSNLDAVQALDKQGSCTSCANLVAALLRANNIPARILAGYPTGGAPLQTHYIVEAYVPDYGWYPIESTILRAPWAPYQQVEVAIVPPEYEDRSEHRPFVAGGVPYLSLTERPGAGAFMMTGTIDETRSCDHAARLWRAFPPDAPAADWERATTRAQARWRAWVDSPPALNTQHRLATPLTADALEATNPAELAKLLAD